MLGLYGRTRSTTLLPRLRLNNYEGQEYMKNNNEIFVTSKGQTRQNEIDAPSQSQTLDQERGIELGYFKTPKIINKGMRQ